MVGTKVVEDGTKPKKGRRTRNSKFRKIPKELILKNGEVTLTQMINRDKKEEPVVDSSAQVIPNSKNLQLNQLLQKPKELPEEKQLQNIHEEPVAVVNNKIAQTSSVNEPLVQKPVIVKEILLPGMKKKKEKNINIADNAYHRLARKAGANLISSPVYYMYNEILEAVFKDIVYKALSLSAISGNRIIKKEVFSEAIYSATGKYPLAPILTGKKAFLPNLKTNKSEKKLGSKKNVAIGRIANQEISTFQKQSNILYIAKTPFGNKIKKYADQCTKEINILYGIKPYNSQYMFQKGVFLIAQSFAEQLLLDLTQNALKLTKHGKRGTLYSEDLALVLEIIRNMGSVLSLDINEIRANVKYQVAASKK